MRAGTGWSIREIKEGILAGQRRAIARAITLTESSLSGDQELSRELQQELMPHLGQAVKIGISGIPGVGKSTLIENLGLKLLKDKNDGKVGVLAVDPSSPVRGGSLLGDKTRMEELSMHPRAFIRPSPGGHRGGGVTRTCRESMVILDAAGFEMILVETIGVGQAEHLVASMVDLFILLHMPGTGDELQGMKKGSLELSEIIVINKADGDRKIPARQSAEEHRRAMQLLRKKTGWVTPVLLMSSHEDQEDNLKALTETMDSFFRQQKDNGGFEEKRNRQLKVWFRQELIYQMEEKFRKNPGFTRSMDQTLEKVARGSIAPGKAASDLLKKFP